jgi:hypothetical protein
MAIVLGKDGSAPPFGGDIISATYTEECEVIDVTNRVNEGGASGAAGYRAYMAGFTTKMWEIECHSVTGVITQLESNTVGGGSTFLVMGVTENIGIDGAVTFTITAREG